MAMVPHDDFTPHGYLDNPYHSWKLNPSGVLRSMQPLGMGWHVPNLGSYVHNQFQYTAHLTIGLKIHDLVLVTPEDLESNALTWGEMGFGISLQDISMLAKGKKIAAPNITQRQFACVS